MTTKRIHADQLDTDEALVRRLVAAQFPQWAELPVRAVATNGTENAVYRLGDAMAVRLPYRPGQEAQIDKLGRWLPRLAPRLPLPIPEPLGRGAPGDGYPSAWSIVRWLDGQQAAPERLADPVASARRLGAFVRALVRIDARGGPAPGEHNFWRGVPLAARDEVMRRCIGESAEWVDARAVTRAWERDLAAPTWEGSPTWLHGDLAPDNLLVREGELAAVIDWGGLGVGDPATELLPAWSLFRGASREAYREAVGFDDATWARGRGLALSTATVALPYYRDTLPQRAEDAVAVIREVLAAVEGRE